MVTFQNFGKNEIKKRNFLLISTVMMRCLSSIQYIHYNNKVARDLIVSLHTSSMLNILWFQILILIVSQSSSSSLSMVVNYWPYSCLKINWIKMMLNEKGKKKKQNFGAKQFKSTKTMKRKKNVMMS